MATVPLVNGVKYSFAQSQINVKNKTYRGIREIGYSDSLEPVLVRGTPAQPIGMTQGEYKTDASMTMILDEWVELQKELGDGYGEEPFDVVINYGRKRQETYTDELVGTRVTKVENNHSTGNEPLTVKLTLQPMYIKRNGLAMVRDLMR